MPWGLAAAAVVGAVGAYAASKSSSDSAENMQENAYNHTFDKVGAYDPNRFNYGGYAGGASDAAQYYNNLGLMSQQRKAPETDYSVANSYGTMGNADASSTRGLAGQLSNVASGKTTTVAQQQAALQSQQLAQQQASQAASARGAAGLALAGQQAATNTANGQAAISQQAQVNAAQERLNSANAAAGLYTGLRAGDLASQQQAAAQAQYLSGLAFQQGQQNDQTNLAYQQMVNNVQNQQLAANIQQQQTLAGTYQNASNQSYQAQAAASQQKQNAIGGAVQGVANGATAYATQAKDTNARAEGGLVDAGTPYLVGERGPEMVVPSQDGLVIPAGPTAQMTGDASGLMAAMQDPQKAQIIQAAQQNPQIGLHLRQQAAQNPQVAAKIQADPALHAIAMGLV